MVSELPMSNAERWQLAQYGENCEYKLHVDTVPEFNDLAPGGRFSTLLLYLDEPDEGGSTDFPDLGLRIRPETGTALYFRNVREPVSDPFGLETQRRRAAGAPVLKGAKHCDARVHPCPTRTGLVRRNRAWTAARRWRGDEMRRAATAFLRGSRVPADAVARVAVVSPVHPAARADARPHAAHRAAPADEHPRSPSGHRVDGVEPPAQVKRRHAEVRRDRASASSGWPRTPPSRRSPPSKDCRATSPHSP